MIFATNKYGFLKGGAGLWLTLAAISFDLSMIDDVFIVIDQQVLTLNMVPQDFFDFYNDYLDIVFVLVACVAVSRGIYLQFIINEKMNEQLSKNMADFRILNEQIPIGIFTYDVNGSILNINSVAVNLLGSPSEEETKKINLFKFPPLIEAGLAEDLERSVKKKLKWFLKRTT